MKFKNFFVAGIIAAATLGLCLNDVEAQATKTSKANIAQAWSINARQSTINWAAVWAGSNVTGSFAIGPSQIRFDPNNLAASSVNVQIPIASLRSQSPEARENLPLPDWLNSRAFPNAQFQASNFRATGNNNYIANGTLTIKGQRFNLALPFSLRTQGNAATMDAVVNLDRLNLKIGVDSDSSAEWVNRQVRVIIHVVANKS